MVIKNQITCIKIEKNYGFLEFAFSVNECLHYICIFIEI